MADYKIDEHIYYVTTSSNLYNPIKYILTNIQYDIINFLAIHQITEIT